MYLLAESICRILLLEPPNTKRKGLTLNIVIHACFLLAQTFFDGEKKIKQNKKSLLTGLGM